MNPTRTLAIAWKECREILRDRLFLLLALLLPVALMFIFGYGLTQEVEHIPFAILDDDRTTLSRDYARRFIESRFFRFEGYVDNSQAAERLLNGGRVRVVLVIGDRFEARLLAGRTATVQGLINGTLINTTRVLKGYIEAINGDAGLALQTRYVARRAGVSEERAESMMSPVRLEPRYLFNQELRTIWAIAPSSIMNILMWTSPLLMALSVVREKERGSIFNVYASGTTRLEFLIGKLLPCAGISFVNAMALWAIATWYFGAPFKGSPATFVLAAAMFAIATSTFGLLVSLWVRTQQSALMIAVIAGSVIAMQFSGMFEAVNTLPTPNRVIAHLFPAMYFNDVVLGTFLKGHGLAESWRDIVTIAAFAVVFGALSLLSFHKRVTR